MSLYDLIAELETSRTFEEFIQKLTDRSKDVNKLSAADRRAIEAVCESLAMSLSPPPSGQ